MPNSSFFPIFLNLHEKKILIIGGGKVAKRKIGDFLPFTKNITVLSNDFLQETLDLIKENSLNYIRRNYQTNDENLFDIVVVAIDDIKLQKKIADDCKKKKILVSCVDLKEDSDFIFGSIVNEKELVIGISTSGISPSVAKYLKFHIKNCLPKDLSKLLANIKKLRQTLPKGKERMNLLEEKVKKFFEKS